MSDLWAPSPAAQQPEPTPAPTPRAAPAKSSVTPERKPKVPDAPSTAQRRASLAVDGRLANVSVSRHPFPGYNLVDLQYEVDSLADAADLQDVTKNLLLARRRLYYVTQMLSTAERKATEAKYEWKAALNRKLLSVSGGTEKERLALAELSVEQEYSAYLAAEQQSQDALNLLRAIRTELDTLQNISYNIRAQMQI